MEGTTIEVELGEGQGTLRFEASHSGEMDVSGGSSHFSSEELDAVMETITAFAERLHQSLAKLKPQKVSAEFGVEIGAESGQLIALIVKGTGTANLKVSLEWDLAREGQ